MNTPSSMVHFPGDNLVHPWQPNRVQTPAKTAEVCLRVLVVEDNPVNREIARAMLSKRGHLVVTVNDGAHGLAEWQKNHYDIILMDIQMPEMDGETATRRIRAQEKIRGGHIPIIALTAHALKESKRECLACGMDGFITKPLYRESFLKVVEEFAATTNARPAIHAPSPSPTAATGTAAQPEPLVRLENMARLIGPDEELQQKVLNLCAEALATKMPHLSRAIIKGDRKAIQQLVHYLRGSVGMLGVPSLIKMGEDIECRYGVMGAEAWQQRCVQFLALLRRIERELRQLHAA